MGSFFGMIGIPLWSFSWSFIKGFVFLIRDTDCGSLSLAVFGNTCKSRSFARSTLLTHAEVAHTHGKTEAKTIPNVAHFLGGPKVFNPQKETERERKRDLK